MTIISSMQPICNDADCGQSVNSSQLILSFIFGDITKLKWFAYNEEITFKIFILKNAVVEIIWFEWQICNTQLSYIDWNKTNSFRN